MRLLAPWVAAAVLFSVTKAGAAAPPKKEASPEAPPPAVTLSVVSPSPTSLWTLRVENTGDVPVRIVADAHLLSFEISPKGGDGAPAGEEKSGKTKPKAAREPAKVRCTLPADMRPSNDIDRALIVPPKRAYEETFDPRLYCFGAHESAALVAGATVVAHLGWTANPKARPTPPLVVSSIEGVEPKVASLKMLDSAPWTLPPEAPAPVAQPIPIDSQPDDDATFPVKLAISTPARIDAATGRGIPITVTVANEGPRSITFPFLPPNIGFEVLGPSGAVHCSWASHAGGLVRELLTTLAPKGRTSTSVLLPELCPDGTFDSAGLYSVRPRLDTQNMAGTSLGVRTFDGDVLGQGTTSLRVRQSDEGDTRPRATLAAP